MVAGVVTAVSVAGVSVVVSAGAVVVSSGGLVVSVAGSAAVSAASGVGVASFSGSTRGVSETAVAASAGAGYELSAGADVSVLVLLLALTAVSPVDSFVVVVLAASVDVVSVVVSLVWLLLLENGRTHAESSSAIANNMTNKLNKRRWDLIFIPPCKHKSLYATPADSKWKMARVNWHYVLLNIADRRGFYKLALTKKQVTKTGNGRYPPPCFVGCYAVAKTCASWEKICPRR